jgi:hypothetical protein
MKKEGQRIIKECCNLEDQEISKFLSLFQMLERIFDEVGLEWDD